MASTAASEAQLRPRGSRHESLGQILVRKNLISEADLDKAIRSQREHGKRLGDVLVESGLVSDDAVVTALAEQLDIPCLRSDDLIRPEPAALDLLSSAQATKYRALPLELRDDELTVAMADPLDLVARDDLSKLTGKKLIPVICAENILTQAIRASYISKDLDLGDTPDLETRTSDTDVNLDDLRVLVNDAPIVKLVNSLVVKAIRDEASDVHVEPQKTRLKIRYRIDGVLYPLASVSRELAPVVVSRIKILANMDIAERRLPQDGRFTVVFDRKEVDLRVSTLPGTYGEKVVLRVLVKDDVRFSLKELGLAEKNEVLLRQHIHRPQGMVLLTGPTGSGKTTTLYACLSEVDRNTLNVITLEDPVEYQLTGIHQVQVNPKIGFDFARGLRTILRQDPDVVMLGEVRDRETAEMAIRAALTGHLVLSTLHANDAVGTVTRLVNMGIEPFLVSEAVSLVGAQRLIRTSCEHCKEVYDPDPSVLAKAGLPERGQRLLRGTGCAKCRNVGFSGRMSIVELAEMTGPLREAVLRGARGQELRELALQQGMRSLLEDGVAKALAGKTTLEEVLRVCVEQ